MGTIKGLLLKLKNKTVKSKAIVYLLAAFLLLPNAIWIFLDNHVWPWDQAWYGQVSVNLYYQATHSLSEWWLLMTQAFGIKAPAIAWIGQAFVPLSGIFGSIDRALLVYILIVQFLTIVVLYKLLLDIFKEDRRIAIIGCIALASAPLFIGMGHQYFVESLQLLGVTIFLYIFNLVNRWNIYDSILALVFTGSLLMAIKITSPLYVLVPALILIFHIYKKVLSEGHTFKEYFKNIQKIILYFLSLGVLFLTAMWYIENLESIFTFMQLASSGTAAELYGSKAAFFDKLLLWLGFIQKSFFFPFVGYTLMSLVLIYIYKVFTHRINFFKSGYLELPVLSVISFSIILIFFSFQINEETRYLLPAAPYFAILLCWLVYKINHSFILYLTMGVFVVQFFVVQGLSLGIITEYKEHISTWTTTPLTSMSQKNNIINTIAQTCIPESEYQTNIVGVEIPYFNANSLSYYASQEKLKTDRVCYYTSLGYAESDIDKAIERLESIKPPFYITLTQDNIPTNNAFNAVSLSALEIIKKNKNFTPLSDDSPSVLIFTNDLSQ